MTRSAFRLALLLLPASLWLAVASLAWGANSSSVLTLPELAKRLDAHYNHLRSLSVQFTETYHGMGMERIERGTLLLAKPGRMRWNYAEPAGKLFVMDGKYAYSYTPGDAQAQRYPAKKLDDVRSPLRFLLGHAQIQKELTDLTMTPEGSDFRLQGVPKGMEQRVSQVELTVTADGRIEVMQWRETDGSTTELRLADEQPNPPVTPETFFFQPPAGVVVVNGLPPI